MYELMTKAVDQAGEFRARFVKTECKSEIDLIGLAIALMQQAEVIFVELSGKKMAAAQFYAAADRIAVETV